MKYNLFTDILMWTRQIGAAAEVLEMYFKLKAGLQLTKCPSVA
jgi:hypothetical protein